jgi:hypothetical protein
MWKGNLHAYLLAGKLLVRYIEIQTMQFYLEQSSAIDPWAEVLYWKSRFLALYKQIHMGKKEATKCCESFPEAHPSE